MASAGWTIRPGRDSDGPAVIALIWACWSAYPGVRMDVDLEMPELHDLATYYTGQGGALWIAESDGTVAGMIAVRPIDQASWAGQASWEICRVYVDPTRHGSGLGYALLDLSATRSPPAPSGWNYGAIPASTAPIASTKSAPTSGTARSGC
jgi:GNAT superfamily N-acetyltransferase